MRSPLSEISSLLLIFKDTSYSKWRNQFLARIPGLPSIKEPQGIKKLKTQTFILTPGNTQVSNSFSKLSQFRIKGLTLGAQMTLKIEIKSLYFDQTDQHLTISGERCLTSQNKRHSLENLSLAKSQKQREMWNLGATGNSTLGERPY